MVKFFVFASRWRPRGKAVRSAQRLGRAVWVAISVIESTMIILSGSAAAKISASLMKIFACSERFWSRVSVLLRLYPGVRDDTAVKIEIREVLERDTLLLRGHPVCVKRLDDLVADVGLRPGKRDVQDLLRAQDAGIRRPFHTRERVYYGAVGKFVVSGPEFPEKEGQGSRRNTSIKDRIERRDPGGHPGFLWFRHLVIRLSSGLAFLETLMGAHIKISVILRRMSETPKNAPEFPSARQVLRAVFRKTLFI